MSSHKARGKVTNAYHRTLISLPERCKLVYVSRASKIPDIRDLPTGFDPISSVLNQKKGV